MLKFLDTSRHYVAAEHISSFPQDGELGGGRGRRVTRRGEKGEGEWVEGKGEKGRVMGRGMERVGGRGWREDWKQGTRVGWTKRCMYTVSYGNDVVKVLLISFPTCTF